MARRCKMIADRVGVSKAAVYYQFQSKEDIVMEVMRPTLEDMGGSSESPTRWTAGKHSGRSPSVVWWKWWYATGNWP